MDDEQEKNKKINELYWTLNNYYCDHKERFDIMEALEIIESQNFSFDFRNRWKWYEKYSRLFQEI